MAHIGHTYYIRCHRTHRVLEIRDFSMADEAKVQMHDKTGNWNQIWKFNIDGTIENPHTLAGYWKLKGPGKAMAQKFKLTANMMVGTRNGNSMQHQDTILVDISEI